MRHLIFVLIAFEFAITVIAQDACDDFVADALDQIDDLCQTTARNEVCYGHTAVSVIAHKGIADFSQVGDIIAIFDVVSITTSPFRAPDEWGIALMRLQADLPDSLPGQNVTVLLLGDVHMADTTAHSIYFKSGVGHTACNTLPPSGLLIQTPRGAGRVRLMVNGAHIEFGSIAFLQASEGFMTVSLLEGWAILQAFDVAQIIPAGAAARVPLGEDGRASGPPQPYLYDTSLSTLLDGLLTKPEATPYPQATPPDVPIVRDGLYAVQWQTLNNCPAAVLEFPEQWITTLNDDGSVTTWGRTWYLGDDGAYRYSDEFGETGLIVFTSPQHFIGWWSIALDFPEPCSATYGVAAEWVSP